jgi:ArsR family transcriptional regulator, arsenate/arsenite/antimonite-responsive transcriptional repressor / arsenate reductase (thioredoxin)
MREIYGLDFSDRRPKSLSAVADRRFDYVITWCDKVREFRCEHGTAAAMHWSLPDPSAGSAGYRQFSRVATELDTRIGFLLPVLAHAKAG